MYTLDLNMARITGPSEEGMKVHSQDQSGHSGSELT